jgi:hypothetical protein
MSSDFQPMSRIFIEFDRMIVGDGMEIVTSVNGCIKPDGSPSVAYTLRSRNHDCESAITEEMACDITIHIVGRSFADWAEWHSEVQEQAKYHHDRIKAMR